MSGMCHLHGYDAEVVHVAPPPRRYTSIFGCWRSHPN